MKTIELTDEVRDDEPVAYMVFCCNDIVHDYKVFTVEQEAKHFAEQQIEYSGDLEWTVYPLWASHGKVIVK